MGWSCHALAGHVMDRMHDRCYECHGSQNRATVGECDYVFEVSMKEHDDGAITGTIWTAPHGVNAWRRTGSFRIEPDGAIRRAPKWLRSFAAGLRLDGLESRRKVWDEPRSVRHNGYLFVPC